MKNSILLLSVLFLSSVFCSAQSQFQRSIGGPSDDNAYSIIQTADDGYVMAGSTVSFGAGLHDMYIVKLDASGLIQWSRTVGGMGDDSAYSIIQTADGGYAVAGSTRSFGAGFSDMFIVKLFPNGSLDWKRTVGTADFDIAYSIIQNADGDYVVAGCRIANFYPLEIHIVKISSIGTVLWSKSVDNLGIDYASSIKQTADGGYVVAGWTTAFGGSMEVYILKLNSTGTVLWNSTIGTFSPPNNSEFAYSVIQTADGGYAMAGNAEIISGDDTNTYVVKLDANGNLQWTRTIGGILDDRAFSLIQDIDGGYVVAGETKSYGAGDYDFYIVKLNAIGTLVWSRTAGGTSDDGAFSIIRTIDGGYAVAGYSSSFGAGNDDMYIVKLDGSGNTCEYTSPSSTSGSVGILRLQNSVSNSVSLTVSNPSPSTGPGGGTVTTICVIGIQPISNQIPASYELYQNYPNPFNPTTKLRFALPTSSFAKLVIYDVLGREMETLINEQLSAGTYEADWNASNYTSGIYFYKLEAGEYTATKKMLLIK